MKTTWLKIPKCSLGLQTHPATSVSFWPPPKKLILKKKSWQLGRGNCFQIPESQSPLKSFEARECVWCFMIPRHTYQVCYMFSFFRCEVGDWPYWFCLSFSQEWRIPAAIIGREPQDSTKDRNSLENLGDVNSRCLDVEWIMNNVEGTYKWNEFVDAIVLYKWLENRRCSRFRVSLHVTVTANIDAKRSSCLFILIACEGFGTSHPYGSSFMAFENDGFNMFSGWHFRPRLQIVAKIWWCSCRFQKAGSTTN